MLDSNVGEIWKPVVGHEGRYEVSNLGNLRFAHNLRAKRTHPNPSGYMMCTLEGKLVTVHKCVLTAFVGPRPTPKHQAAHGNGISIDNRVENLRWATPLENSADKYVHGTGNNDPFKFKYGCPWAECRSQGFSRQECSKPDRKIKDAHKLGKKHPVKTLAFW